jgi:hypothetical protein
LFQLLCRLAVAAINANGLRTAYESQCVTSHNLTEHIEIGMTYVATGTFYCAQLINDSYLIANNCIFLIRLEPKWLRQDGKVIETIAFDL